RRPCCRQGQGADHNRAHPAQHCLDPLGAGHDSVRHRHPRRGGPFLSWPWRSAAAAVLGPDAVRRPDPHDGRAASGDLPRPCHRRHRPRAEPSWRRLARRARSQTEARAMSLLEIEKLCLNIGNVPILKDVDLTIEQGEVLGLVGESGSGKSMTSLAVMQLLPFSAQTRGRITFDGVDILAAPEAAMNKLRGNEIGMVFQEPMTALNPVKTIGEQVAEGIRWHTSANRADAEDTARKILDRVGLPESQFPLSRFPHELSGGQRQRVVIAIACALKPKLLIADEPTTA